MSNKNSNSNLRHTPSPAPSSPSLNLTHAAPSKLPKFLQNKATRDRSRSVTDPAGGSPTASSSTSASVSASPEPYHQSGGGVPPTPGKPRKTSKFLSMGGGSKDKEKEKEEKARRLSATPPLPENTYGVNSNKNTTANNSNNGNTSMDMDDPPVIVEPMNIPQPQSYPHPRARTRSERPASSAPESSSAHSALYASTSAAGPSPSTSASRIGDILPARLSGWFHQITSASSTDLSLPALLAQQHHAHAASLSRSSSANSNSPSSSNSNAHSPAKGKAASASASAAALLSAAKHGRGHLDKAMRYLLDSDATPDKCADPIWLLGVRHQGYEAPPPVGGVPSVVASAGVGQGQGQGAGMGQGRRGSPGPSLFRSSTSSIASSTTTGADGSGGGKHGNSKDNSSSKDPSAHWPPVFYMDFTSRVWLTYRSHFPVAIRDQRLGDLPPCSGGASAFSSDDRSSVTGGGGGPGGGSQSPSTRARPWNWGGEKTWASDSGWGCMLRTGQSVLANALVRVHLGRDWRRPPHPVLTADYATYVQILTWFLDTPAPDAPFSVHRMALAGKELGTDVGQWFGPSVAAGAIRTLVTAFPECGLAVSVATDGTLYQTQVFAASHGDASRSPRRRHTTTWGDRPVLLLLGIRLGIEGVNPIYYDTIK
ncbi:hypothetical protein CVT25_014340, partial [Psilocybe cyanescens]